MAFDPSGTAVRDPPPRGLKISLNCLVFSDRTWVPCSFTMSHVDAEITCSPWWGSSSCFRKRWCASSPKSSAQRTWWATVHGRTLDRPSDWLRGLYL